MSSVAQILLAYEQEPWFLQYSPTEQARRSKYSPKGSVKMEKADWDCQNLQEVKIKRLKFY